MGAECRLVRFQQVRQWSNQEPAKIRVRGRLCRRERETGRRRARGAWRVTVVGVPAHSASVCAPECTRLCPTSATRLKRCNRHVNRVHEELLYVKPRSDGTVINNAEFRPREVINFRDDGTVKGYYLSCKIENYPRRKRDSFRVKAVKNRRKKLIVLDV